MRGQEMDAAPLLSRRRAHISNAFQTDLNSPRGGRGQLEVALHHVGPDIERMRTRAATRQHANLVDRIVEFGMIGQ